MAVAQRAGRNEHAAKSPSHPTHQPYIRFERTMHTPNILNEHLESAGVPGLHSSDSAARSICVAQ